MHKLPRVFKKFAALTGKMILHFHGVKNLRHVVTGGQKSQTSFSKSPNQIIKSKATKRYTKFFPNEDRCPFSRFSSFIRPANIPQKANSNQSQNLIKYPGEENLKQQKKIILIFLTIYLVFANKVEKCFRAD